MNEQPIEPKDFAHELRVAFADTDMAGMAHFTAILRWVEEAEAAHRRANGGTLCLIDKAGVMVGWPKLAVSVEYASPAFFEDVVTVRLGVERDGNSSRVWRFSVRRKEDATLIAHGTMTVVHLMRTPDGALSKLPVE